MEADEDDPDDIAEIFKIKDNLFDFETPLCKAFNKFNYLLKIDTDLFTFDIQEIKNYKEYELNNNMTGDLEEPWSDNELKEEALMHKAILEESWEDAAPGVMKFCAWIKSSFENFHKLDYDGPYANAKTKNDYDPYLDINRNFGRNYKGDNAGNTQDNKKEHHGPSIYNIRRFEMMKYSFDADDEYVVIKERKHSDHSRTNVDTCQDYRELFCIIDRGWLVTKAKEE
nr:hypothetical protein [Tanacetum cinerariifolium]